MYLTNHTYTRNGHRSWYLGQTTRFAHRHPHAGVRFDDFRKDLAIPLLAQSLLYIPVLDVNTEYLEKGAKVYVTAHIARADNTSERLERDPSELLQLFQELPENQRGPKVVVTTPAGFDTARWLLSRRKAHPLSL